MNEEKPLITKNQAIYLAHKSKNREQVRTNRKKFFIRELMIILASFIIALFAVNYPALSTVSKYWWQNTTNTKTQTAITNPPTQSSTNQIVNTSAPSNISIPKINVTAPIVWDISYDQIHANLDNGVVHYSESAHPGEIGNMFMVGHSSDYVWSKGHYKTIFALLPKLSKGDKINISYHGIDYIYEVYTTKIVSPIAIDILQPTDDATLTLMTCWPIGTSQKRFVVQAKLLSPKASGTQNNQPSVLNLPKVR